MVHYYKTTQTQQGVSIAKRNFDERKKISDLYLRQNISLKRPGLFGKTKRLNRVTICA
jgi:hypothetical protein